MSPGEYLVILNVTRWSADRHMSATGFGHLFIKVDESATRNDVLEHCLSMLDDDYFRKEYRVGELDMSTPAMINYFYAELN